MPQDVAHDLFEPAYLALARSGVLGARVDEAWRRMRCCDLCARYCRVDRLQTTKGAICRTGPNRHAVMAPASATRPAV